MKNPQIAPGIDIALGISHFEPLKRGAYRSDIQALRGYAVLLVIAHHAALLPLRAGYLGVDIFFVISGYLVTQMLLTENSERRIDQLLSFYSRRARRLLPAAYVCMALTTLMGLAIFTHRQWSEYGWQQLGAVAFAANFVLWSQTGYFESEAQLKPLLHFWSLSLEEQYYLLLPVALMIIPRDRWRLGISAATVLSCCLCIALAFERPGAAFYLLPTRAWELGLGSMIALGVFDRIPQSAISSLAGPAVAILVLVPAFATGLPHPGVYALLTCIATAVLLLRVYPQHVFTWPLRGLARIGDVSYSLYLFHWPLISLSTAAWLTPIPYGWRCCIVAVGATLSCLCYRYVEQPCRQIPVDRRFLALTITAAAVLVATPFAIFHYNRSSGAGYDVKLAGNTGLHSACEYGDRFEPSAECMLGSTPELLLWGDSHAMHLADGLVASGATSLVQATKSMCGPLIGVSAVDATSRYNAAWAHECLRFNTSVLEFAARTPSVRTVVLSSALGQYVAHPLLMDAGASTVMLPLTQSSAESRAVVVESLHKTISALRDMGKSVVFIASPPSDGSFDIGKCLERRANHLLRVGKVAEDCSLAENSYLRHQRPNLEILEDLHRRANVQILRPGYYLCREGRCRVSDGDLFIYRDAGHLSHEGSAYLGRQMSLWEQVRKNAH